MQSALITWIQQHSKVVRRANGNRVQQAASGGFGGLSVDEYIGSALSTSSADFSLDNGAWDASPHPRALMWHPVHITDQHNMMEVLPH